MYRVCDAQPLIFSEQAMDELEEAGIEYTARMLANRYLSKISRDLRSAVLDKPWPLDGDAKPHRAVETWEDVARAVRLVLSTRANIKAPTDKVLALGDAAVPFEPASEPAPPPPSAAVPQSHAGRECPMCGSNEHQVQHCPTRVSVERKEYEGLMADYHKSGKVWKDE